MKCKERVKMEIQLWRSILCPYELAVRELEVKFNHIIDECKENDVYCPIEQVEGRVKSVSSILEKMQRKHIPMERMEEELEDIAGVRIICQFEEDIETVASLIQKRSDMVIKSEKNYLKHIKQSGYRSYHLIIYYTVDTIKGPKKLQAEIQIRTMAMNFWATIEHSLQYKYKGPFDFDCIGSSRKRGACPIQRGSKSHITEGQQKRSQLLSAGTSCSYP